LTREESPFAGIDVDGGYGFGYSTPILADLDGDGLLDLVVGKLDGTLSYWRNVGTPSQPAFKKVVRGESPFVGIDVGMHSAPSFVDLDGDNDLDLVVGDGLGRLSYFQSACRKAGEDGACSGKGICSALRDGKATCLCPFNFAGAQCDSCVAGQ